MELAIPKLRTGTSTRKADDPVKAWGDTGISKPSVSRICKGIDADVAVLRTRTAGPPAVRLRRAGCTYVHVREAAQVVSKGLPCRHAMRNLMAVARHDQRQTIAALIGTIFAQPDDKAARSQLRQVVDQLADIAPKVAERLQAMEDDLLASKTSGPGTGQCVFTGTAVLVPRGCRDHPVVTHLPVAASGFSSLSVPPACPGLACRGTEFRMVLVKAPGAGTSGCSWSQSIEAASTLAMFLFEAFEHHST